MVCSAQIYDRLFHEVRVWTQLDFTPQQIQEALDRRYRSALHNAEKLSAMRGSMSKSSVEDQQHQGNGGLDDKER